MLIVISHLSSASQLPVPFTFKGEKNCAFIIIFAAEMAAQSYTEWSKLCNHNTPMIVLSVIYFGSEFKYRIV